MSSKAGVEDFGDDAAGTTVELIYQEGHYNHLVQASEIVVKVHVLDEEDGRLFPEENSMRFDPRAHILGCRKRDRIDSYAAQVRTGT